MATAQAPAGSEPSPAVRRLAELPRSDRRDELEALVTAEFREILLMDQDEELPFGTSYFDLGFTSLRITEVKGRLEDLLGCSISTNLLFNSPTVAQLLEHLETEVFPQLFAGGDAV